VLAFGGIWVEKGMGLIVPGFIPSPIGEVTEYFPTLIEVMMTIGLWAMGFLLLTILLKGAIGIMLGDIKYRASEAETSHDFPTRGATATLEAR
jgi:Ni/Fe-hydrogenase subunit HybB-like protein